MDYRHRDYYLVNINSFAYNMRMRYYKLASPSLKIHQPYYHLKNNKYSQDYIKRRYWQMMLSCKKEDSEALEYELRKAERRDGWGSRFLKLDKELCGQ